MSLGDDEKEAGRRALWILRSEGIDIRLKEVCTLLLPLSVSKFLLFFFHRWRAYLWLAVTQRVVKQVSCQLSKLYKDF